MATTKQVSVTQAVFNAVYATGAVDAKIVAAIQAAGGAGQDDVKRMVYAARISVTLKVTQEAALIILGKKGENAKDGDNRRTPAEEKAYGAARTWFTGFLQRNGLVTKEARGGDRSSSNATNTEGIKFPSIKVASSPELSQFMLATSTMLEALFAKNATHPAFATKQAEMFKATIVDFVAGVKEAQTLAAK